MEQRVERRQDEQREDRRRDDAADDDGGERPLHLGARRRWRPPSARSRAMRPAPSSSTGRSRFMSALAHGLTPIEPALGAQPLDERDDHQPVQHGHAATAR